MVTTAALLALSYLSPVCDPYHFWYIAFLGMAMPILILTNCIFLLIFTLMLSRWALIPLLLFLIGIGHIGDYVGFNFITTYPDNARRKKNEIKLLTYNVHGFRLHEYPNGENMDSLINYIISQEPDIVCLQELKSNGSRDSVYLSERMSRWKYVVHSYLEDDGKYKFGLAVYSRFPLTDAHSVKFSSRQNSSMYVDVNIEGKKIRLFNNHLQSTQFTGNDKKELISGDTEAAAKKVGNKLRESYKVRAFQADTISALVKLSPHPVIVVGDFNDTPASYVVNVIRGDMSDSFRERGQGYGYTYTDLFKLFRIDYVLHSKDIETIDYESPPVVWSDHKPVVVKLQIR